MVDFSLLESLHTDIAVAPPKEYADSSSPNLLPEGTYDLYVKSYEPIMDRDDPTHFKGFNIQGVVAEGDYEGRGTGRLSIWASPYLRNGVKVSGLGDFIRALDATAVWESPADAGRIIQMAIDRKMPFRVKLGWEAFDQNTYEEKGGKGMVNKSPEQKQLRKDCTIKGMAKFPVNPDGSYQAEYEFENGDIVEARLSINNFIASHKRR
jgi:hypothetical protein